MSHDRLNEIDAGRTAAPRPLTALVTGFEPYRGADRNPSGEIARALDGEDMDGLRVVGRVFGVSAESTPAALRRAIDEIAPDVVLMLGVWPGRGALAAERVAVNVLDFPFPDNDGAQPVDVPVQADGPAALFSTVPVRAIADSWREHGIPGAVSNTAGAYLCNQSFYTALLHTAASAVPVGFVHIPTIPSEAARHDPPHPSMSIETLLEGVRVALLTVAADARARP
jgi:pyroglutamyl-peptidase